MGKNSQIHLFLETSLLESLKKESIERGISLSELCRLKLTETIQLTRIELSLDRLERKVFKSEVRR